MFKFKDILSKPLTKAYNKMIQDALYEYEHSERAKEIRRQRRNDQRRVKEAQTDLTEVK